MKLIDRTLGAISDTKREKERFRVGTRSDFGQRKGKSGIQNRTLVELQTQKAKIRGSESEPGSTSDTESENQGFRVGTRINFRHRKRKSGVQSRDPDQLRTQKGKKSGLESEPRPTSDTGKRKAGVRVRTRSNFEHKKGKRAV
jgi:hypothetical protein